MKTSPMLRLLVMGVILMALNVPLTMMCGVVERTDGAAQPGRCRGQRQLGRRADDRRPVLSVPVSLLVDRLLGTRAERASSAYHFLPEALEIDGTVDPANASARSSPSSSIPPS